MTITNEQSNKPAVKKEIKNPEKNPASMEFNDRLDRLITAVEGLAEKIDKSRMELAPGRAAIEQPEDNLSARTGDFWFLKRPN